jgi:signal transduction histidine kinase/CheY-like chemotaxis protein
MTGKRILIVAGNYDIIQYTRQALAGKGFAVEVAYSHRDAMYILGQQQFELALVDAAMVDRYSNAATLQVLSTYNETLPVVAFALNGISTDKSAPQVKKIISVLDKRAILQSVADVLHIPINSTGHLPPIFPRSRESDNSARRIEEIQTLFALSKSLAESLDLSEVLNRVVEAARYLTNAEEGMILLPDEEGEPGQLYLRAKVGIDTDEAQNFRVKTDDTIAGNVFNTGEPVLVGARGPQKVKTEYFVNSLLYVPILYHGEPMGVLGVNNRNSNDLFDENHRELLVNLASYAAVAIQNARIHLDSVERARELEVLVETSQVVNSSVALDRTLPSICQQLAHVLNVHWVEIYELERTENHLRSMARYQRVIWRGRTPVIDLKQRPNLYKCLENNRALLVTAEGEYVAGETEVVRRSGAKMMIAVPVTTEERVLGVIQSFYIDASGDEPTVEELKRSHHLVLEALVDVSNLNTRFKPQNVFRLMEDVNLLMKADWSELSLFIPETHSLTTQIVVGEGAWLNGESPGFDLGQYPDLREAVEQQTAIVQLAGKSTGSLEHPLLEMTRGRAVLALPLVQRGQTQGLVLFVDTLHNRVFSRRELDMGRAIVGQAATALENVQLIHDLEASLQELKATQDRLVQTTRLSAMGELAAAVAHQINNPLTTIMVDTELMLLDEPPGSPNYRSLEAISRAGKRAASVVRRLLAAVRSGGDDAQPEPIDVIDTIEGTLSLVRGHIEQDHIRILPAFPTYRLPAIWAIQGQLDDIWLNLLLNAHDALVGRAGAEIGIEASLSRDGEYVEVVVWDNGPGVPAHILSEIFKPFFTTKPVGQGTGLGLHICRQVVDQIGGSIEVQTATEQGTHFIVRLPTHRGGM